MVSQVTLGTFFTNADGKTVLGGAGGSGLDTQSLIKSLTDAKSLPITMSQDKITLNGKKSAALASFQGLLSTFQSASDALRNPPGVGNAADNVFKFTTASVTSSTSTAGSTYLSVTTTPGATNQSYTISDISSLATSASHTTAVIAVASADASATLPSSGANRFTAGTVTVNGQAVTLVAGDSLNTIAAKFNAVSDNTGITATVIQIDSTHYTMSFVASETGTDENFDLTAAVDPSGVFDNVGLGTKATQNSGIFTIADANTTIVSAAPIGGTANQFAPGTITLYGQSITLNEGDTLNTVAAAFNAESADTGIAATVVTVAAGQFRLQFSATRPGPSHNFNVLTATDPSNVLTGAGIAAATGGTSTAVAATNAEFKINGIDIERQTNSVSDVVTGVTFNLLQETPALTNLTVSVQPDRTIAQNSIVNFVNAYNALKTFATEQTQLNDDGTYAETAILANNQTFLTIMADINANVNARVKGIASGSPSALADVGITFINQPAGGDTPAVDNVLNVNDGQLTTALATNFNGVAKLFGFSLTSNNPNLRLFSASNSLAVTSFTINADPDGDTFTATYNLGAGPVTVDLTARAITGATGYTLTGQVGTALEGMAFIYGSEDDATISVSVTQGIADKVFNTGKTATTAVSGTLAIELKALEDSDKRLEAEIVRVDAQVAQYRQQLLVKFGALEQAISRVNTLLQSLQAQQDARNSASG